MSTASAQAPWRWTPPDTDSIAETLGRELVEELGYGRPETQFGLSSNGRVAWCDLRLGRHVFEVDGRLKLLPVADGGLSEDGQGDLWLAKQRRDFVTGFKIGMSHIVWADFWGRRREVARERLRREFLDTSPTSTT